MYSEKKVKTQTTLINSPDKNTHAGCISGDLPYPGFEQADSFYLSY